MNILVLNNDTTNYPLNTIEINIEFNAKGTIYIANIGADTSIILTLQKNI